MKTDLYVLSGVRTPMAEYNGALASLSALELGALAARAAIERSGLAPQQIDHVVMGNALQTSGDALYGARHVGLKAGVPIDVPALTVNRLCGSGIQSIVSGAQMILLGEAGTVLAGGMESMSQAPHVLRGLRGGLRMGTTQLEDSLMTALLDTQCGLYMAQTSDNLARRYGITRQDQDEYAFRSQQAATAAWNACRLAEEVVPVTIKGKKGDTQFGRDDHMRPDTTLEVLAKLKPAFAADSSVTAGNASGIVDGGAAVVLSRNANAGAGGHPLGCVRDWAIMGVEPEIMGIGPVPAIRKLLDKTGLKQEQIGRWEINEAFAGQFLAVERELGLDRSKVNVNGGAIALGHPLGATGTRLVLTLLLEMRRSKIQYGIASACIGGGQGIAILLES